MVDITFWEKDLASMAAFYAGLDITVLNDHDKFYARLAKQSAKNIVSLVKRYKEKHNKRHLQELHANIKTLTRGIEKFNDPTIEEQHGSFGQLQYELLEYLEKSIRW